MFISSQGGVTASLFTLLPLVSQLQTVKDENSFILNVRVRVEGGNSHLSDSSSLTDNLILTIHAGHRILPATLAYISTDEKILCYESTLPIPTDLMGYTLSAELICGRNGALLAEKTLVSPPVKGHDPRSFLCHRDTLRCEFHWGTSFSPVPIPYRTGGVWLSPEALFSAGVMDRDTYDWICRVSGEQNVRMRPDISPTGWSRHNLFAGTDGYQAGLPMMSETLNFDGHTSILKSDAILPQYGILNFHYE